MYRLIDALDAAEIAFTNEIAPKCCLFSILRWRCPAQLHVCFDKQKATHSGCAHK
jgi:hypothetical protein